MYEWILGVFGLFVVGFLFIALNQVVDNGLYDYGNEHIRINASNTQDAIARDNFVILDTIWNYMPLLMLFLFLLWVIIQGQKRVPPYEGAG